MNSNKIIPVLLSLAGLLSFVIVAHAQNESEGLKELSNAELVKMLSITDEDKADEVVKEVLSRGEKMISFLIEQKGDNQPFYGVPVRNSNFATEIYYPSGNRKSDDILIKKGKLVTVEVASIFLITSIFYDSLNIAQSPLLTDLSLPRRDRRAANTAGVVDKAWSGIERWYAKLGATSLAALRKDRDDPLNEAGVSFW